MILIIRIGYTTRGCHRHPIAAVVLAGREEGEQLYYKLYVCISLYIYLFLKLGQ